MDVLRRIFLCKNVLSISRVYTFRRIAVSTRNLLPEQLQSNFNIKGVQSDKIDEKDKLNHQLAYLESKNPISAPKDIAPASDGLDNGDAGKIENTFEPYNLSPEEIREISCGDVEIEKKIQFILMELDLLRQEGARRIPSSIPKKHWQELLSLRSRGQRLKFYNYIFKGEVLKLSDLRKRKLFQQKLADKYAAEPIPSVEEDPNWMHYGLNRNTIFLRLYDTKVALTQAHKIISEMSLGTPIVMDCGYNEYMSFREAKNASSQIEMLYADNREHPQPFNIVFCNVDRNSDMMKSLAKRIPTLYEDNFPIEFTEKSYLDLYDKEKLVYLSPHAKEYLTEFNHDEIYIIGAVVDKSDPRPFSVAKAKREGIRIKKLPLDEYVRWGLGNKSLTLNQMINIMLEVRQTGSWKKAFQFIPTRKLVGGRTNCPDTSQVIEDYNQFRKTGRRFLSPLQDDERIPQFQRGFRPASFTQQKSPNFNTRLDTSNNFYNSNQGRKNERISQNASRFSVKSILDD